MSTPRLTELFEENKDKFTGFQTSMGADHRYIHEGIAFSLVGDTGAISAAGTYALTFITPPAAEGLYIHLRPAQFATTANTTTFTISEGATNSGTTAASSFNRNRNSSNVSKLTTYKATTVSGGTAIYQDMSGGGSSPTTRAGGAGSGSELEIILKPATTYSLVFANVGASTATTAYYTIYWYEEKKGL